MPPSSDMAMRGLLLSVLALACRPQPTTSTVPPTSAPDAPVAAATPAAPTPDCAAPNFASLIDGEPVPTIWPRDATGQQLQSSSGEPIRASFVATTRLVRSPSRGGSDATLLFRPVHEIARCECEATRCRTEQLRFTFAIDERTGRPEIRNADGEPFEAEAECIAAALARADLAGAAGSVEINFLPFAPSTSADAAPLSPKHTPGTIVYEPLVGRSTDCSHPPMRVLASYSSDSAEWVDTGSLRALLRQLASCFSRLDDAAASSGLLRLDFEAEGAKIADFAASGSLAPLLGRCAHEALQSAQRSGPAHESASVSLTITLSVAAELPAREPPKGTLRL